MGAIQWEVPLPSSLMKSPSSAWQCLNTTFPIDFIGECVDELSTRICLAFVADTWMEQLCIPARSKNELWWK